MSYNCFQDLNTGYVLGLPSYPESLSRQDNNSPQRTQRNLFENYSNTFPQRMSDSMGNCCCSNLCRYSWRSMACSYMQRMMRSNHMPPYAQPYMFPPRNPCLRSCSLLLDTYLPKY
jgi:hypothetical protein